MMVVKFKGLTWSKTLPERIQSDTGTRRRCETWREDKPKITAHRHDRRQEKKLEKNRAMFQSIDNVTALRKIISRFCESPALSLLTIGYRKTLPANRSDASLLASNSLRSYLLSKIFLMTTVQVRVKYQTCYSERTEPVVQTDAKWPHTIC